ncbi:GTP-binding protein, partial [Gordonia desulfuricans]|nr:GTP-binding protein [Gordonia desulfuricans]
MTREPIPVIVVAGFLGAGKTTLLNHLLRGGSGARIGVLVNDFGAVNIDAMLVAGQVGDVVGLTNGCMCCAVDRAGLDDALSALARPAAQLDAIVIEASGIAEPKSLIRMITAMADPRMRYGGLVYLVDAALFETARRAHPEIDGHVAVADLVVLNKTDLVDVDALTATRTELTALNPSAPQLCVTGGRIDPALLFDIPTRAPDDGGDRPIQLSLDALLREADDTHAGESGHVGESGHL